MGDPYQFNHQPDSVLRLYFFYFFLCSSSSFLFSFLFRSALRVFLLALVLEIDENVVVIIIVKSWIRRCSGFTDSCICVGSGTFLLVSCMIIGNNATAIAAKINLAGYYAILWAVLTTS